MRADLLSIQKGLGEAANEVLSRSLDALKKDLAARTVPEEWKANRATLMAAAQKVVDSSEASNKHQDEPELQTQAEYDKLKKDREEEEKNHQDGLNELKNAAKEALCFDQLGPLAYLGSRGDGGEADSRHWNLFAQEVLAK